MDVGAVNVSWAMAADCKHCGKKGHSEDSCWYSPASKSAKANGRGHGGKMRQQRQKKR